MNRTLKRAIMLAVIGVVASGSTAAATADARLAGIKNIVVIYAENHSFDNMYGMFPGANGISRATPEQYTQLDHDGKPLKELIVFGPDGKPDASYPRMPNAPFRIDAPPVNRSPTQMVLGPVHAFYHNQEQINGGKNNMFAAVSNVGGLTMGYYDGSQLKLWQWAKDYTLADNFFMGAFGGSFLNHQYLICACTPKFPNASQGMQPRLDANGKLERRPESGSASQAAVKIYSSGGGQITPDGYAMGTTQPPYQPSGIAPAPSGSPDFADPQGNQASGLPLPPQTAVTIGDTLSKKGVNWAWFSGGYNLALADGKQPASAKRKVIYSNENQGVNFQAHHQPFNYFARFAPQTKDREKHLKDGDDFFQSIAIGNLPAVSFYKPKGMDTQHPSYTTIAKGDAHIAEVLTKLKASPQWKDMLIVVTYDENGGFWDHVAPPSGAGWGDRWGPGTRIPTLLIGPSVKRGYIDSTPYDTTSILKLITKRFDLEPLAGVRAKAGDLMNALK